MLDSIHVRIPDDTYWQEQVKCQSACPVHTDARGYVRAIARGDYEEAYLIARGPNPLASICGRVCGARCEAACRRSAIDEPVSIRALKRFVTERFGPESFTEATLRPLELLKRVLDRAAGRRCKSTEELSAFSTFFGGFSGPPATGEKVAIIGSGPAGLAAAHDLALMGLKPVVYEMEPMPAGMLAVGIPEYRLPRDLIQAEVEVIRALGVEFICNTQVGKDIGFEEIRRAHRATIIAVGAKRSRSVPVPGGEGKGILGGVEFLRDVALRNRDPSSTLSKLGRRVVVIGGGNVAYDVSRTLIRQIGFDVSRSVLRQEQVSEVHLCCLESIDEMPADDVEILEGHEEGVQLHTSLGPAEILLDDDRRPRGVKFNRCIRVFDESGRFAPQFDKENTVTLEADTVVWAIGQQPDISFLESDPEVARTERGGIKSDPDSLQTTAPDVFVAGDIAYGARLLIDAIASGKKCARSVYGFVTGRSLERRQSFVQLNLSEFRREPDYEKRPRTPIPIASAAERMADRRRTVEQGYDEGLAVTEACRCLDCGVNTIFDSERCILCGGCADVCPELCLQLVSCDRLTGDPHLAELMKTRYGDVDPAEVSAIVKDEEKCIRCALCAERCPVGAITMERFGFSEQWQAVGKPEA
ncbi:MAG: FAD-dependent oxidoreductase [Phycisphaerae bacterium]